MKVCQLLPELRGGGVEKGTIELSQYLVKNGHQSLVISGGGALEKQLSGEHIQLSIGKKSLWSLRHIAKLRDIFATCDIVHSRSRLPAWLAYFAWKKMPKKSRPLFVTTIHGFNSVSQYSKVMTFGERVIAVSQCVKDYAIRHYKVNSDSIKVIHRGVDSTEYNRQFRADKKWIAKWENTYPQEGQLNLLLPGRITQLKGIEHFIKSIYLIKQKGISVRGFVVGGIHPKKEKYYEYLKQFVKKYDLSREIIFTGQRNDLREIMSWVDIVCNTTLEQESFGRTCNESLALGKPFLGYNHGGIAEQLDTLFQEGRIDVGDYQGLAFKAIEWFKEPPIIPQQLPFSLENMCSQILEVYQK